MTDKNVYIAHATHTWNYWTFMMLINFLYYVDQKHDWKIKFFVEFTTQEDYDRLIEEVWDTFDVTYVKSFKTRWIKWIVDKVRMLFFLMFQYKSEIMAYKPDVLVMLWWDDFSEYYGKLAIHIYMMIVRYIWKSVPLFFIWQTLWPFTWPRRPVASDLFTNSFLTYRDSYTQEYMQDDMKVTSSKHKLFADLAFLELPKQWTRNMLGKYSLIQDEYIVVVPSWLRYKYTSSREDYIRNIYTSVSQILKNGDYKVVLLAHVFAPAKTSDVKSLESVYSLCTEAEKKNITVIDDYILASQAREILWWAKVVITGRMHASISTFQMLKPAIPLSYSIKYKWVIWRDLWLSDLIVEAKWDEYRTWQKMSDDISKTLEYTLSNYEEITTRINTGVKRVSIESMGNIDYFVENI